MSESSSGTVLSCCSFCQEPFSESISYCKKCAAPRYQAKVCLLCHNTIPDTPQCNYCFAPQDPSVLQNMPSKKCINPQCGAILVLALQTCYRCRQYQQIQLPSCPQSEALQAPSLPYHIDSGLPMASYSQSYGLPSQGSFTQTASQQSQLVYSHGTGFTGITPQTSVEIASAGASMNNFNVIPSYQISSIPGQTPLDFPNVSGTVCHSSSIYGSTQTTPQIHTPATSSSVSSPFQIRPVQRNDDILLPQGRADVLSTISAKDFPFSSGIFSAPSSQTSFGHPLQTDAPTCYAAEPLANNARALSPQPIISSANSFPSQTNTDTQLPQTIVSTNQPQNINANVSTSIGAPSLQTNDNYTPPPPQTNSVGSFQSQATQPFSTSAATDQPQNINAVVSQARPINADGFSRSTGPILHTYDDYAQTSRADSFPFQATQSFSTGAPSLHTNDNYAPSPQSSSAGSSPSQATQSFSTSAVSDQPQKITANALTSTGAPLQTNDDYTPPETNSADLYPSQATQSFSTSDAATDQPQNSNANASTSTGAPFLHTSDDYAPSPQTSSAGSSPSQVTQSFSTSDAATDQCQNINANASTSTGALPQMNNDYALSPQTSSADSSVSQTSTDTQASQISATTGQPQDKAIAENNNEFPQTSDAKSLPFQDKNPQLSHNTQNGTAALPSQKTNVSAIPLPHASVSTFTNTSVALVQTSPLTMVSTSSQIVNSSNSCKFQHENPDSIGDQSEFHTPPSSPLPSASHPPIAANSNCEIATNEENSSKSITKAAKSKKEKLANNRPVFLKNYPQYLVMGHGDVVSIVFHALLPPDFWQWDEESEVYIKFSHENFGKWEHDFGPMNCVRSIDEKFIELEYQLKVNRSFLLENMQYKYCVYTNITTQITNAHFECIYCDVHGIPPEYANRVLKIFNRGNIEGCIHQYDTIIYSSISNAKVEEEKGWWKSFKGLMSWSRKSEEHSPQQDLHKDNSKDPILNPIPDTNEVRKTSLEVYLTRHIEVLKTGVMNVSANDLVKSVGEIYSCLYHIWVQDGTPDKNTNPKHWKPSRNLKEEFKKMILTTVKDHKMSELYKANDELASCNTIVRATLIICCLQKLEIKDIQHEALSDLLNLFILYPNVQKQHCPQLGAVKAILDNNIDLRNLFLRGVKLYCERLLAVQVASKYLVTVWRLIFLMHFLTYNHEPFIEPVQFPPATWIEKEKDIFDLVKKVKEVLKKCQPEFVKEVHNSLKNWFKLDPPLLPVFIFSCPHNTYEYLYTVVDPSYSLSRTAFLFYETAFKKFLPNWLSIIHNKLSENESFSMLEMQRLVTASRYLMSEILKVHEDFSCDFFKQCISLFLQAHSLAIIDTDDYLHVSWKDSLIFYVKICVRRTIGGEHFGKRIISYYYRTSELECPKEEFELWDCLQSLQCSGKIKKEWDVAITEVLLPRIKKLPSLDWKIEVLTRAEARNNIRTLVMEIIINEVIQSLHDVVTNKPGHTMSAESRSKLERSRNISSVLENVLKKKYPYFDSTNFTIKDILEWDLWPIFMRMYDGTVPVSVLQLLIERKNDVEKLCEAVTIQQDGSLLLPNISYDKFSDFLGTRLEEYNAFISLQEQLVILVQQLQFISIPEIEELKMYLSKDISMQPINKLCTKNDDMFIISCFQSAAPLFHILPKIRLMCKAHSSNTFLKIWNAQIEKFCNEQLKLEDVIHKIWDSVFCDCSFFLESLKDRTVKLATVDKLLDQYGTNEGTQALETELISLEKGISECINTPSDGSWIGPCVQRMQEYRSLRQHITAAKVILKVKEALSLAGDFEDIENLADQFEENIQERSLIFINDNMIKAGEFLHGITDNKLMCLDMLSKCKELIEWIRKETEDIHHLQDFVTIALATASGGEDDYTRDALSNLRSVGSGFATLIYQLPEDTGYNELEKCCESLWESLALDSKLAEKLDDCNKRIDWYKSVKEMQGSVEKTSFGQVDNIKKYGSYTIGSSAEEASTILSELIQLDLMKKDKSLARQKYTLDELKDLRSKLVLITGDSEERTDVDHFLSVFNKVCHIAEVLVQLQQHGHSQYVGWRLTFRCNLPGILDGLTEVLKKMIHDLEEWEIMVAETREHFYCLNYYTTQQLLLLRKELSHIEDCNDMKPDVLSLLESISKEVTAKLVLSVLKGEHEQEMQQEQDTLTDHDKLSCDFKEAEEKEAKGTIADHIPHQISSTFQPKREQTTLTCQQKGILANVKETCGFSEKLILLAFEKIEGAYDRPIMVEDIEKWCVRNEDEFEFSDDDDDKNDDDNDNNELDNYEEEEIQECSHMSQWPIEMQLDGPEASLIEPTSLTPRSTQIRYRGVIPVNKDHPVVKKLLLAGFFLKSALEAAEKYPDNVQKAMAYIDDCNDDDKTDGIFPRLLQIDESSCELLHGFAESVDGIDIQYHKSTENYLSLKKLAELLHKLSKKCRANVSFGRKFSGFLKEGEPNLITVASDGIFKAVLSLYMESEDLPLPTHEEVLICSDATVTEEVILLWKRALEDPNHFRIFCLVHAERLSYQVGDKALRSLTQCSQGKSGYKIVIVCNDDDSHIVTKLQQYKRPYSNIIHSQKKVYEYLFNQFTRFHCSAQSPKASDVDPENSYVRLVTSERAGMGKSLYIKRMEEDLASRVSQPFCVVSVPVHGPKVTNDAIVQSLKQCFIDHNIDRNQAVLFHLDISPSVIRQVDCVLFSLLILQGLSDCHGKIWRCQTAHYYVIEITVMKEEEAFAQSSIALFNLLPTIKCISPRSVLSILKNAGENCFNIVSLDLKKFRSEHFQRVYQYLERQNKQSLDSFSYELQSVEGNPNECLQVLLSHCGVKDPTWLELSHFIVFLSTQLKSCELSVFCNAKLVGDVLSGLKTFVVKFMIQMSKDFATSSLKGEVSVENEEAIATDKLEELQIDERKLWEQNYHPYLFFNEDKISITFIGFNVSRSGDLQDPVKNTIIERRIMTTQLYKGLQHNRVNLSENYQSWKKETMIHKLCTVMGLSLEKKIDPDPTYVLTVDNVIKIVAIHMRFRCSIPVVIMGETGCGKTRLIRYMCDLVAQGCKKINNEKGEAKTSEEDMSGEETDEDYEEEKEVAEPNIKNMIIMKIHGGTTETDIVKMVKEAEKLASINMTKYGIDTVLFFDEANTSDALGLIKEVMCDRKINGRQIVNNVKFIAACNPYRKHTNLMINKLESAGLGFFVKANETQQKLGKIPLRQLVYRVLDLPPSMRPLVYDFGQLNFSTEKDYIFQIVKNRCLYIPQVTEKSDVIQAVTDILVWSQNHMREKNDECSFVSLRDVERAMIVFSYFCQKKDIFNNKVAEKAEKEQKHPVDDITRSLILAVSVCYHARLTNRAVFEEGVAKQFKVPLTLAGRDQFCTEIRWCQDILLDNMKLGKNIARNAALRENIFMMVICIELRIPLFLVGKPGSSKSLAKSIVSTSMLGRASEKELMKEMKAVQMFSYQCSQLSTPESVIEVFEVAKSFQTKEQDVGNYVSVVVLDEVGLAEDSPNLPLKALHPLLEDGTEGADSSLQIVSREQRVAFIGISNWALDPAKMNRGVMVTRGDPDETELELSAREICSNAENDPVRDRLAPFFKPLSSAYKEISDLQDKYKTPFFGLRDFYSLIKMLYWMCKTSKRPLTRPQLKHAVKRNFGGLDHKNIDTYKIFKQHLKDIDHEPDYIDINNDKERELLLPDCSPLGLIRKSLQTKDVSWHGENRYLLFLTENYSALQVLNHYLRKEVGMRPLGSKESEISQKRQMKVNQKDPFVLFGSSFPKDREYTQVCRNINQIKICMDTGRTVILLNLDNLYESLYDLLNQYYIRLGDQRYVDLGLQTHRFKCRVHNDFKLILIAEKSTVYNKFPTPLINRLEKHFVLSQTALLKWQNDVLEKFRNWIQCFSEIRNASKFSIEDAFIGYKDDTPASVVYHATEMLQEQWGWPPECEDISDERKKAVLSLSKKILLQMASPDAIIRLKLTRLDEKRDKYLNVYYADQHHGSFIEFINHHLSENLNFENGLLLQVTTHSHVLSSVEVDDLSKHLHIKKGLVKHFLLQEFDTEMDFSHKIGPLFSCKDDSLLIIQCDYGQLCGELIACARYRVEDEREKAKKHISSRTNVLFIIHYPHKPGKTARTSFVGFQGGNWIYAHIDNIRVSFYPDFLYDAQNMPISRLFYSGTFASSIKEHQQVLSSEKTAIEESFDELESEPSDENLDSIGQSIAVFETEEELPENVSGTSEDTDNYEAEVEQLEESQSSYKLDENEKINETEIEIDCHKTKEGTVYVECTRLYNCIQAAVAIAVGSNDSRKRSAIGRVKLLLQIIPQTPKFPLDTSTFYGALVMHIKHLLQERETISKSEWVLEEAISAKKLQSGGTFQNVLKRRLDEIVVPIFAAILAFIDQYSNLSLLGQTSSSDVRQLWLSIFNNHDIVLFSYENYMIDRGIGQNIDHQEGQTLADAMYTCQFPFFWLVKQNIDSKLDLIKSSFAKEKMLQNHMRLCEVLNGSPIAIVLKTISKENWMKLYKCYFGDFIRSIHNVLHKFSNEEYEILEKALNTIIISSEFHHTSFLSYIAAAHVVYHEYQQDILWFGQLTRHIPGILYHILEQDNYDSQTFEVPLQAVKIAIGPDNLALPLESKTRQYIHERLVKLHLCQNTIDSILSLRSSSTFERSVALSTEIRLEWQRTRAIQLFIEHVAMRCSKNDVKFDEFVQFAKRIEIILEGHKGFIKKEPIVNILKVLRVLDKETGKRLKHSPAMQNKIRGCCKFYFMEVVSTLCFGQPNPPDEELIKELLNIVFAEKNKSTKEFTFSEKDTSDKIPVMRSFMLQLLLEHSTETVQHQLSEYFSKACQLFENDCNLYLLCIQCLEDSVYKQCSQMPFKSKVNFISKKFKETEKLVKDQNESLFEKAITFKYLEGVAMLRYSFSVVAELIYSQFCDDNEEISYDTEYQLLLNMAKIFCSNFTERSGPELFLAKQIGRQYGITFLKKLTNDPNMQWIIPKNFGQAKEAEDYQHNDPFVIYKNYNSVKTLLLDVAYEHDASKMDEIIQNLTTNDVISLIFAIYQVVTGSNRYTTGAKKVTDSARTELMELIRKCDKLTKELIWIVQHLIMDTYYGKLEVMTIRPGMDPKNKLIIDIIIHVATVMQHHYSIQLLMPFIQMIKQPGELKEMYLPTMPEDPLPMIGNIKIKGDESGKFYKCPKGHPYFIGNCGRPYYQGLCYICKSPIGGQSGQADEGNEVAEMTDTTEFGYVLGQPNERETAPSAERYLSPSFCSIIRALMHASFLWSSCTNEQTIQDILDTLKTDVKPVNLSLFFWQHLEHDINMLSAATGKSFDDACIILHLILKTIASNNYEDIHRTCTTDGKLDTREKRKQWEKDFSDTFIQPVLLDLDKNINEAIAIQLDLNKDCDLLFHIIHERISLPSKAIIPHLWSYRPRLTLTHLLQVLQQQKHNCPLLHEFLIQEPLLRATQCLPDIVKLQQQMYQLCHRKFDTKEASKLTIGMYINNLRQKRGIQNSNKITDITQGLNSIKKAWKLVKDKVGDYARIVLNANLKNTITWDNETPLSFIIPTLTGDGVHTVVLVKMLVTVHNNFIEMCHSELKKRQMKDIHWQKHEVPVSQLQYCHLLSYDQRILSIVLSHCHYSLEYGKGQKVEYDLPALEKHMIDQFVHGKPQIILEIPQVVYRKDFYTTEVFAKIRKSIGPQEKLSVKQQADIIIELGSMQRLRDCLDVVEIVIGFLSSDRRGASTSLKTYIQRVLQMEKQCTSEKVLEYCTLGHILSLWLTLSVEIAKTYTLNGQEPFDDFNEILLTELDDDQKQQLLPFLRKIDLPLFLDVLYEFLETTVRHYEAQELNIDWSLKEVLPEQFEVHSMEHFPDSISVGQSVAAWKEIVLYQQKLEKN